MKCFSSRNVLALLVVLAGTGCGGGGSSSISPTVAPTATNVALWVANGTNVLEILPTQSGISEPAPRIMLAGFGGAQGVQFDANGDLWVLDGGNETNIGPALDEFTPAQLAAHETATKPTASKTITYKGIRFPQQGVFDKNGDFWVADNKAGEIGEIVEFTAAQLGAGGSITPNLTLKSSAFDGPLGIAFSPITGELWVANNGHTDPNTLMMIPGTSIDGFTAASVSGLTGTRTIAPSDILKDDGLNSIQAPWALVFDPAGDLWSSNSVQPPSTIVEFAAGELGAGRGSRSPAPNVTISPVMDGNFETLYAPNGLAFDSLGGLWAVSTGSTPTPVPAISLFAAWQLAKSDQTIPSILLGLGGQTTPQNMPTGDAFGPVVQ